MTKREMLGKVRGIYSSVFQCVLAVSVTSLLSGVSAQVNSEIDQFEDLLAVDSFANEVSSSGER